MDSSKEQQIVELIKTRPDLNYVQISFLTGTNLTAVHTVAKKNDCQRSRGRKPWKAVTAVTTPAVSPEGN